MSEQASMRPSVLIVAYACEPGKGSEQGVGWNWVLQMARFADVTVITRANNRAAIESAVAHLHCDLPKFIYYDPPGWVRRFKRGSRGLYPFYFAWQLGSRRAAKALARERRFTYVHHLTFGNIWLPVTAHRLPGTFIYGPIGGGEGVPDHLLGSLSGKARVVQTFRRILIATLRFNPIIMPALNRADKVLVRTPDTMRILPERIKKKATCILETAVHPETLRVLKPPENAKENPIPKVLFTGRLVGFKNVEMLLHAAARARANGANFSLRLIGDGPERKRLVELAQHLYLNDWIEFVGVVPHAQVMEELRSADVFAFPSLREGGAWSLMEAMCAALPVICINTSGMSVITDDTCAIRIEPTSRDQIIEAMASGLEALCKSPEERFRLGQNARARMQESFLWERVGDEIGRLVFDYLVDTPLTHKATAVEQPE